MTIAEDIGHSPPRAPRKRRPARAPKISETQEHLAIASYFKKIGLGGHALAWHHRNERAGHMARIVAFKMGVKAKLPDWEFLDAGHSGFIELKPRGWKARTARTGNYTVHEQAQLKMHRLLRLAGAWVEICETLDEVLDVLHRHGVPLRSESLTTERIKRGFAVGLQSSGVPIPAGKFI
jgi:hypothetical protein